MAEDWSFDRKVSEKRQEINISAQYDRRGPNYTSRNMYGDELNVIKSQRIATYPGYP